MPNLLVHDHTDGALGDIPHNSGATVVELMRHTLVNGTVHLNIHILSDLEIAQVRCQGDVTLVPEGTREQVSRPGAKSMASRHLRKVALLAGVFPSLGMAKESRLKQKRATTVVLQTQKEALCCKLPIDSSRSICDLKVCVYALVRLKRVVVYRA